MCCCTNNTTSRSPSAGQPLTQGPIVLRIDDMTCGHCARAIKAAVETEIPGAEATANPATKTLTVRGTADAAAVRQVVASAGYTPSPAV